MLQDGELTAACSGSLIAPQVVLTAGHCVDGFNGWRIKAPFAGDQSVTASDSETYDWNEGGAETVNPDHHDIGLVYLPTAITIDSYPILSQKKIRGADQIVNIGRIQDGTLSNQELYVSSPIQVTDGAASGYPFDYAADEIIQSGDSGGPDILVGGAQHTIVAVNSGAGTGSEVLARVDLLYAWIADRVQAHGGFAAPPSPDPGPPDPSGRHDAGAPPPDDNAKGDQGDNGDTSDEPGPNQGPATGAPKRNNSPCGR
jgi:hypothetical protein